MIPELEKRYFLMTQQGWDKKPKISNSEVVIGCPICDEGNSKGKKQRCYLYRYNENIMVHCFNCGIHHHFRNYLKNYFPNLYKQYIIDAGLYKLSDFDSSSNVDSKPKELKLFTFEDVKLNFKPATESKKAMAYLYSRGVNTKYFKLFYYTKDYKNFGEGIVIPFWYKNKMYGFQYRSINKKLFHIYMPEQNKGYKIYNYFTNSKKVYVFESVFDLFSNDIPLKNKISSLGSDLDSEKLKKFKEVIFCFDNDETGLKKAEKYADLGFSVFIWPDNIKQKDFNEILQSGIKKGLDAKEVRNKITKLIEKNTFNSIEAKVRLKLKE